jgi:hypothetical protein
MHLTEHQSLLRVTELEIVEQLEPQVF